MESYCLEMCNPATVTSKEFCKDACKDKCELNRINFVLGVVKVGVVLLPLYC